MNGNGHMEEKSRCSFHPKQVDVGVCPLCLNERLLIVAAKQGHHHRRSFASIASKRLQSSIHRSPSASIHKIFAFGSLFSRPESQQLKSESYDYDASSPSPEGKNSFISIKFEENGVASWEKNTVSKKVTLENSKKMSCNPQCQNLNKNAKSVIEQCKSNKMFRWRKRIGKLFHLIHWKRSTKGGVCQVGSKVERVKVRKGLMRTLTKRKTVE
ncbi:uncharacterized protein LOC133288229 [Gastrolobium bilobum]|uniref:uncharacterized protein LOC133288229 n=1 Tax=Gastrolobium bilobum TaxID=150636 RepID=UPI002AAF99B6|nr:uncharacterized protein LOC133288229 [Gastrolobium bilobum]